MEQLIGRILNRSSDAIVVVRLADRTVLDVNEAFFAVTGHPQHQLAGGHVRDLLVQLSSADGAMSVEALDRLGALANAPTGLWTRSGELRVGSLSALVVDVDGQPAAVCTIRDVRDPTPVERRLAARARLTRVVQAGGPWPEVATSALQALGDSLRWDFGALWLTRPETPTLGCAVVWRAELVDLEALEETSWRAASAPGVGLVQRSWRDRQAAWVADALAEPDLRRQLDEVGEPVHGWFGFPVWVAGDVVGVVEFFSREVRQPDEQLLRLTEELGRLFGQLLETAGRAERSDTTPDRPAPERSQVPRERRVAVSSALRNLEEAVANVAGAMERQPVGQAESGSPELLGELVANIGRLDRLLEGTAEPSTPAAGIPSGLTLQAVSRRTGIPAATLRTWERRYGFLRPTRSASGYRLYGEQEIAQILQVKHLLGEGVRTSEAIATVRGR
jgi:PAS domain S-box-containing protein